MLNKIKLLLGLQDNSKDNILTLLIESAIQEAVDFTHNDSVAEQEDLICDMVVWKYNRLGTEGVDSESYSGVSFHYSTSYPDTITSRLKALRKVRVL